MSFDLTKSSSGFKVWNNGQMSSLRQFFLQIVSVCRPFAQYWKAMHSKYTFNKHSESTLFIFRVGFPGGSGVKNPPASAGAAGSIPGSGRSPGEGNGNPLQYSCLGNLMDRGALWATFHGITKVLDAIQGLNNNNIFKVKYGPTQFNQQLIWWGVSISFSRRSS